MSEIRKRIICELTSIIGNRHYKDFVYLSYAKYHERWWGPGLPGRIPNICMHDHSRIPKECSKLAHFASFSTCWYGIIYFQATTTTIIPKAARCTLGNSSAHAIKNFKTLISEFVILSSCLSWPHWGLTLAVPRKPGFFIILFRSFFFRWKNYWKFTFIDSAPCWALTNSINPFYLLCTCLRIELTYSKKIFFASSAIW